MISTIATMIIMATSTIDGVPYSVSSTACSENSYGCFNYETKEIFVSPESPNKERTLYHELGHYKYQYFFYDYENKEEVIKFWEKYTYYKKGTFAYEYYDLEKEPWESMAKYYVDYKLNTNKVPKAVKNWFKKYEI